MDTDFPGLERIIKDMVHKFAMKMRTVYKDTKDLSDFILWSEVTLDRRVKFNDDFIPLRAPFEIFKN
jgi:hypothetical protein